jgi:CRP/FNR family cyclic AMP-dependent transcriptional regulator
MASVDSSVAQVGRLKRKLTVFVEFICKQDISGGRTLMIEQLREAPLFSKLTDAQLQQISNECTTNTYPAGTILFRENDIGTVFYLVLSGAIKIYTSNQQGEDKILSIFTKGDSFGELSLLDGKPRSATAQSIEETKLISLTAKNFNKLLREHFDITLSIVAQLSTRLRETNQQLHDVTYLDAKQRVMKNLVKLAGTHGSRDGKTIKIKINLNYDEVSQLVGVAKPLLFQVFNELQSIGILHVMDNEFVLDLKKLKV